MEMNAERWGGEEHEGVRLVAIGWDGETYAALGHIETSKMLRAVQCAARCDDWDSALIEDLTEADVKHRRAVVTDGGPADEDEWIIDWAPDVVADSPDAFNLTTLTLSA